MIVTNPASGMGAAAGINRINSFCRLLTEKIFLRNKRSGGKRLLQNTDYSGGIARIAATAIFALGAFAAAAILPADNAHAQRTVVLSGSANPLAPAEGTAGTPTVITDALVITSSVTTAPANAAWYIATFRVTTSNSSPTAVADYNSAAQSSGAVLRIGNLGVRPQSGEGRLFRVAADEFGLLVPVSSRTITSPVQMDLLTYNDAGGNNVTFTATTRPSTVFIDGSFRNTQSSYLTAAFGVAGGITDIVTPSGSVNIQPATPAAAPTAVLTATSGTEVAANGDPTTFTIVLSNIDANSLSNIGDSSGSPPRDSLLLTIALDGTADRSSQVFVDADDPEITVTDFTLAYDIPPGGVIADDSFNDISFNRVTIALSETFFDSPATTKTIIFTLKAKSTAGAGDTIIPRIVSVTDGTVMIDPGTNAVTITDGPTTVAAGDIDNNGNSDVPGADTVFTVAAAATATVDICSRTDEVENTLLAAIRGTTLLFTRYTYTGTDRPAAQCGDVTSDELAAITTLNLLALSIPTLKAGDFADLTGLTDLQAAPAIGLTSLEAGVFDGLTSIETINLSFNSLTSPLPRGILDDVLDTLTEFLIDAPSARVFLDPPAVQVAPNGRQTLTVRLRNDDNTANVVLPQRVRLDVAATGTAAANVNLYATGTTTAITSIDIPAGDTSASFDMVVGSTATPTNTAAIALSDPGLLPVSGGTVNTGIEESQSGLVAALVADETTNTLTVVATTPALALNSVTTTQISDESDNITVDLTMNGAISSGPVSIAYAIAPPNSGNSVSAADFTDITDLTAPPAATATADGSTALQFTLNVQEDNRVEGDEAGIITITSITPQGGSAITPSGSNTANLEIIENDGFILTLPDVTTDDTVGDLAYVVTTEAAPVPANAAGVILDRVVPISIVTSNGTAIAPGDYTNLTGLAVGVLFPANASPQTAPVHDSFTITIIDDEDVQAEAFEVSLSSYPTYLSVAKGTATITINPAPVGPTAALTAGANNANTSEKNNVPGTAILTLPNATEANGIATVDFVLTDSTATRVDDYILSVADSDGDRTIAYSTAASGLGTEASPHTFTLPANRLTTGATFTVTPVADGTADTESVVIMVTNVAFDTTGGPITDDTAAITIAIADYGTLPTTTVAVRAVGGTDNDITENAGNAGRALFDISFNNQPNGAATVRYTLAVTGDAPASGDISSLFTGNTNVSGSPVIDGDGTDEFTITNASAVTTIIIDAQDDADLTDEVVTFTIESVVFDDDTGTGTDISTAAFATIDILDDDPTVKTLAGLVVSAPVAADTILDTPVVPGTTEYRLDVMNTQTSLTFAPTLTDTTNGTFTVTATNVAGTAITVANAEDVASGTSVTVNNLTVNDVARNTDTNTIVITVIADDDSEQPYTFNVAQNADADLCFRTEQVATVILGLISDTACQTATLTRLNDITSNTLNFRGDAITALKAGDFEGLSGVDQIDLRGTTSNTNDIRAVVAETFSGLLKTKAGGTAGDVWIRLNGNDNLATIDANAFMNTDLEALSLGDTALTTLPATLLNHSPDLLNLNLNGVAMGGDLEELPATLLSANTSLEGIRLDENPNLTSLPPGFLDGPLANGNDFDQARLDDALRRQVAITGASNIGMDDTLTLTMEVQNLASTPVAASFPAALRADIVVSDPATGTISGDTTVTVAAGSMTQTFDIILTGGAGTETFNVKLENLAVVSTANDAHASTAIIDADISDGITNTDVAALTATAAADRVITVGAEPPSNDASLADLTAGPTGGSAVAFTPAYSQAAVTNAYEVNLPFGTENVTVIADPNDGDAVVTSITGTANGAGNAGTGTPLGGQETTAGAADETITANLTRLVTGRNTIEVLVTAQDNTPRTYTLTATVAAPDGISVSTDTNTLIEGGAAATFTVHFVGVDVSDGNQIRLNLDLPGAGTFTASNANVLTESNNQWRVTFPTDGQVNGSSFFRLGTAGRIGFNVVGGVGGSNFRLNAGTQDVPIMIEALSTGPGARDAVVQLAGTADVHQSLSRQRQITPSPRGVTYSVEAVADPTDSSLRTATVDGDTVTFSGNPLAGSVTIDNASTTGIIARPRNDGATVFVCTVTTPGTGVGAQLGTGTGTVTVSDAAVPNAVNTFRILVAAVDNSDSIDCTSTDTAVGSATLVTGHTITVNVRPAVVVTPTSVEVMSSATDVTEGGAFNITVTLDAPVAAGETVTLPYVFSGTGIATTDFSYTVAGTATTGLTGSLVFAATQQSKVIAVTPTADGTAETGGSETLKFKLTANDGTGSGYNRVVVEAGDEVDINITDPVALGTITMINSGNNVIEIGRESAEVTLRVNNVFPAAPGAATDFLAVNFTLVAVSGFRDSGRQPSHFSPTADFQFPPYDTVSGESTARTQEIVGNGGITLSLPDNIGTSNISAVNRPFLVRQANSSFRVIMPRALFANGTGTQTAANMEDVRIILTPNPATVVAGDTELRFGTNPQAGYYPMTSLNVTTGALGSTRLSGESRFNVTDPDTEFSFKFVHPYSSGPLPSTMNPTAQDVVPANVDAGSSSYNREESATVTVALPSGITAPAGAVRADVILDFSSTGNTITSVTSRGELNSSSRRDRFFINMDTTGDTNEDAFATLITPTFSTKGFIYGSASIPSGAEQDIALRTFVTAGQPLYGEISFSIFGHTLAAGNNVIITATGIQFYDSANAALGSEVVLTDSNALGRVATVNMIAADSTNVLSSLTVGGEDVLLTVSGTGAGVGIVDNLRVASGDAVAVVVTPGDFADGTIVAGTDAAGTDLGGIETTATVSATARTVMVSGFTPGFNRLTVTVDDAGGDPNRVYTISVFVPPDRNDSTLASATVNGVAVVFPAGTVTIPPATMAAIVATPVNPEADFYVCAGDGTSGGFLTGDVPVTSANTTDYTIYVVAPVTSADVAVAAPNTCAEAATDVTESNASDTTITITVSTASADLSALTVTPSGGSETPIFVANTEHYGVTLADNTTSAVIVATPVADDANIAITVAASGTEDSSGTTIATATCDDTTSGANTCTVSGIDAGETAVVTITVTSGELLNVLTKRYTIAIGPASARLVLSPTAVAPGAAVNLTLQVRNYDRIGAGGFLNAQIFAKEGAVNADIALETNLDITIPSRGTLVADGAEFSFNVSGNTGIAGTGGGYDTTTGGFRLIVPKALLDAGNNSDAASLVNGVNFVVAITAKEDVRIVERRFSLGTVDARLANQDDGRDTTADPIANVDTDAVALGITATTRATLDYPEVSTLGTDGAILVASDGSVDARVRITNPRASADKDMRLAFRVRTETADLPDDNASAAFLKTRTVDASNGTIIYTNSSSQTVLTIANNLASGAFDSAYATGSLGESGWVIDSDAEILRTPDLASPLDITLTITPGPGVNDGEFYTLEFAADSVQQNIDALVTPRTAASTPANRGRIEIGAIEQTLVMTPGETISHAVEPASIGTTAAPGMLGRIPLTLTLDSIPTGLTEIVYQIAAGGAHAKARNVDYGIGCQRLPHISGQTNCRTGEGYDLDGVGGIGDTEQITTGTVVFPAGAFDQNVATFEMQITPFADSVVEGTETVVLTLIPPAGVTAPPAAFTVNITDATTSSVTVSTPEGVSTVAEGTTLRVTVSLDDQGETDTDEDGNEISIAKIVAEDTEFTLQRLDLTPDTPGLAADEAGDEDIRLTTVTIDAGEGSGFIDMLIVPDGDTGAFADVPESFRLEIASIAASAVRPALRGRLPEDDSGPPQRQWVATSEITINMDAVDNTTNATLETDGLTVGGADPIGFEPGPIPPATGDAAAGGTISLAADTLSVEVIADPDAPVSAITEISGRQGNDCTAGTALGVNVPEAPAPQIGDAGATITATVGGETGEAGVLVTGENCIRVIVTAGDTTTTNTYDVIVTVVRSDEARLAATTPLTLDPTGAAPLVNVGTITYSPNEDDPTSATATIALPAGTTAGALVINARDPNALIDNLGGSVTGTLAGTDIAATADLTVIANEGTITFDVTAEDRDNPGETGTVVSYTITIVVQDAELASASFAGRTSSNLSDNGTTLTGSGDITGIPAGTTGGELFLVPADTDDTIIRVTGVNESGANLTGIDADDFVHGTANTRTVTLGNIGIGTSEVKVVVRPAGAEDDTADRTYTISLIVTPNPAARVAGIMVDGATTVRPAVLPATRTDPVKLNFFARDFSTASNTTSGLGTNNTVQGISFTLRFAGIGPSDTATNFAQVGATGVLNNNYFRVEFPTHGEDSLAYSPQTSGGSLPVEEAGDIRVIARSPDFISDGAIYIPVEIEMLAAAGGTAITGGTVSIIGAVQILRSRPGTRVFFDSSVSGDDRDYTPVSPNIEVAYSVVAGPSVTLDAAATATEAGPTNGTLDMVLTHNLGTLDNEPAIVTYTIGGDAVRGANADYTLNVGGVAPANCNASGEGCTYRFSGSANATQTAPVVVMPRDDSVSEDDEMVTITITALSFPNVAQGDQPESIVLPDNASEVTITDNDADVSISAPVASSIAENSETSTTFTVDISSAANSEATITLSLTGATYGGDTGDYTIASSDLGSFMAPDDGDETGDITGTITPSNGTATATFTVTANDDSELSEGEETIRITLTSVTGTDTFARTAPTTRTIAIVDNDVVDTRLCDRTGAATQVILDAVNGVPGVDNRSCDDPPTVAQLGEITELDLREVEVTELEEGVLENLNGVETLMLPVDSSNEPIITTIAPGALDPVLPTLSTLTGFPTDLRNIFSVAAVPGQEGIQQGGTMELLIARSNVRGIPPFVAATIEYELTVPPGAAAGDFTVSEGPTTAGTTAFAASQSTVGPLAIAPNQTNTGTLTFDTNDVMKTVIIEAADGVSLTGEVVFRISEPVIERVMGSISNMIIGLGTTDVTLPVVRATAAPTLSGDVSISEKSEEEGVITLNLGTGTDEGTATVTFSLSNPDGNQMPTTGNPIPRLAASDEDSEGDYTLVIMQDRSPVTLVPPTIASTGNTFTVNRDVSAATFTFTAINDDRKEGNEVVTLTITNVNFTDENAPDYNRPLTADIEITEVGGDAVMRETAMISQAVGKEQVGMTTRLIRQRISGMFSTPSSTSQVSARTDTQAHSLDENGMQISLAENPQTIQDFFSQMALEKSGSMDQGGNYAVWVRGQYVSISGSPAVAGTENFEYDGTIVGVGSGIERRYNNYLVGLSLNYSTADIDSKSDLREQANYKETMNIIAPYAAWQPQNLNLTLWGTAGYGFGSAEISSSDHTTGSPSVSMFFAQGGVNRTVSFGENSSIVLGISALSVSKTVDGYTVDIGPVPELSTDIFQAQADATVYMPVTFGESVVRPYFGIATVHDIGDVQNDDRHAMEGRVGVSWLNGPWSVNLEGFNQFLREDEKAWGVFGEVSWVGTRNFDGLFMGMTGGHGTAASMSDTAAAADSVSEVNTVLSDADSEAAEWSFQTNTEYGFAAPLVHRDGRATPFFRTTHSADARSFESGVRMDMTNNVGITMETNRHIPADDDPYSEHAVGLEARWAF